MSTDVSTAFIFRLQTKSSTSALQTTLQLLSVATHQFTVQLLLSLPLQIKDLNAFRASLKKTLQADVTDVEIKPLSLLLFQQFLTSNVSISFSCPMFSSACST